MSFTTHLRQIVEHCGGGIGAALMGNDGIPIEQVVVAEAEDSGLIAELGEWALRTACQQAKSWQDAGLGPIRIAVNLSSQQFRPGLVRTVRDALESSGLAARHLVLELTESESTTGGTTLELRLQDRRRALAAVMQTVDESGGTVEELALEAASWDEAFESLIVSQDPVAADAVGLRIIQARRREVFGEDRPLQPTAHHIQLAETVHGLGIADMDRIDLVRLGWDAGALI